MRQLSEKHQNFHYIPCISGSHVPEGFTHGRVNEVALASLKDLKGWRVFVCGHPDMVNQTKRMAYLNGTSMNDIYADAFHVTQTEK